MGFLGTTLIKSAYMSNLCLWMGGGGMFDETPPDPLYMFRFTCSV